MPLDWKERRKKETRAIKDALIKAGFKQVSVTHGRGTAFNWIEVTIHEPHNNRRYELAQKIVLNVSGRARLAKFDDPTTDYNASNVGVYFDGGRR